MRPTAFYEPDGADGGYRATAWTRGPWSRDHQHGGPPAALLARAVEAALAGRDCSMVRFTAEFLRPVPIARLRVQTEALKRGRLVERYAAHLWAGDERVLTALALCLRRRRVDVPQPGAAGNALGIFGDNLAPEEHPPQQVAKYLIRLGLVVRWQLLNHGALYIRHGRCRE